jgi:hypothetical protein
MTVSDRPQTYAESRERLVVTSLSALITVGMISQESADALLSLWRRGDHLTPVELDALADGLHRRDDGGLAEQFLERRRQAVAASRRGDNEPRRAGDAQVLELSSFRNASTRHRGGAR